MMSLDYFNEQYLRPCIRELALINMKITRKDPMTMEDIKNIELLKSVITTYNNLKQDRTITLGRFLKEKDQNQTSGTSHLNNHSPPTYPITTDIVAPQCKNNFSVAEPVATATNMTVRILTPEPEENYSDGEGDQNVNDLTESSLNRFQSITRWWEVDSDSDESLLDELDNNIIFDQTQETELVLVSI